ncbi:MAG: hypothetical protein JWQ04_2302 [Pedosphaera sp.]|nr:hypothetical protein [Pedosphaera sp.]
MKLSLFRSKRGCVASLKILVFTLACLALGSGPARAQMVDLNGNGISDVWEWVYGSYGIDPTQDADGDGFSNLQEAIAGTNPFDSNSFPHVTFTITGTNLNVSIACALGKAYQLQSVGSVGGTNWVTESNAVARTGTNIIFTAPMSGATKFYRIAVGDVDTDGDGVNDWEEYQLGLDPNNPLSNGQQDSTGQAMNDYAYVTGKLAQQNRVTITAADGVTTQPDSGQSPTDLGAFVVTRGGFALNAIDINLGPASPGPGVAALGVDYQPPPSYVHFPVGMTSLQLPVRPLANTSLVTPVVATLNVLPGTGYTVGSASNASVVIYPSATANGTGLLGQYYTNSSATYTNSLNFRATNLFLTRIDPAVDFIWSTNLTPNLSNGAYTVRWTGQVRPQYSENYIFDTGTDDGVKLWVNDQLLIDKWQSQGLTDWTNTISLQAGVRYDLKMEYLQVTGSAQAHLYWYSPSQSRQIIPSTCLYATNSAGGSNAPAAITSALYAVAYLGVPFSYNVTGANTPLGYSAGGLPPGLGFNPATGLISGVPNLAGSYPVMLTTSNAIGGGASVVNIQVIDSGSSVTREIWTNIAGINISDIPTSTPASLTNFLGTFEGITNYGDNYGERVRGYFTAPVTGNYYFWIAGSDSAQLWISDDNDPVNKVLRAFVTPTNNPPLLENGTGPRQWNWQPSQQSPWLTLTAGQQYYVEILHKAGVGTNDNWAVGWLQDPSGTNTAPTGVVPGYALSRYFPPLPTAIPGTLYTANMLAIAGVNSTAVGSATLRLSADGSQAVLKYTVNGISGGHVDHIYSDPYLNDPTVLMYDIAAAPQQPDGSYIWQIKPTGPLSAADILEIIAENKASIVIQTPANPAGEISGHFTLANGAQIFTPPPAPPVWADDHADSNAAVRFLTQATFGANSNDIALVQSLGYDGWISNQFSLPVTHHLPLVLANFSADPSNPYPSTLWFNTWWQQSVTAPDQLRQRVAFALSEIMVISENGVLQDNARALSSYYDTLLDNSFGNYRALLKAVTLTPGMGLYLNMQGNDQGNIITGIHANENFAREIQQLFSVGLNRLWPDGTLVLNSQGNLSPTYNQNVIMGFASVFTGWTYYQTNQANGRLPTGFFPSGNYTNPMVCVPTHHDHGTKLLLDNVMLPAAQGLQTSTANVAFDNYALQDLESAMDSLYNHQNIGPFICRQLIQRLVTSNPNRDYLYRVVQKFNDNGSGVRGDMQAVIRAILLDYEARGTNFLSVPSYGKQREPLVRITEIARAFPSPTGLSGTYAENGDRPISITNATAHRLNNGDTVELTFTDTSGNPSPVNQAYSVTVTGTNTFTVNAPNLLAGTYTQATNTITVTVGGHGLLAGNAAYLAFPSGGAVSGLYLVATASTNSSSIFTVSTPDGATRSGSCLLPKISASGFVQSGTNVTVYCSGPHGLSTNETLFLNFSTTFPTDGQYQVATIPDATHFTIHTTNSVNQTQSGFTAYPLGAPALTRSGTVGVRESTWNMGYTDTSSSSSLSQSPLRSPTVFNFFFPNFEFPGALASAGLTTPEFQLTSDTSVALQLNFLQGGLLGNTGNTNGLSSFSGGNGGIVLDLGQWMTTNYTSATGLPGLVDSLGSRLLAGQLSPNARADIISYVGNTTNFGYSTPPTQTQMRDRVRAVVHLLVTSPDFTIQQ